MLLYKRVVKSREHIISYALQEQMAKERGDAINGLMQAIKGQYPHVEPPQVQKLTDDQAY